jgi:hypothetical protein
MLKAQALGNAIYLVQDSKCFNTYIYIYIVNYNRYTPGRHQSSKTAQQQCSSAAVQQRSNAAHQ